MTPFNKNIISKRRSDLALAWATTLEDNDAVLICCGEPISKPGGLDQNYYFLPHPAYFWMSGKQRDSGIVLYSKKNGWIDFLKPVTTSEMVWEGAQDEACVSHDYESLDSLVSFLNTQNFYKVFILGQPSVTISKLEKNSDLVFRNRLSKEMDFTRRIKDEAEVELILEAARIANRGYQHIKKLIAPGVSEKMIQIEFESEIQRNGAHKVPYDTIVGAGSRSGILHAIPTMNKIKTGDLVLVDAGADLFDYCVDITRVFPASGIFSEQQQSIYAIVLEAQRKAIALARHGVDWKDVHYKSAGVIADGLKHLNILKGEVDSILGSGAISVFYPHGVGHLVGLRVRDTGCEENKLPQKYCGVTLRVDLKIQEHYILTVEPGCYFIPALFNDQKIRTQYKDLINWSELEKWKDFGGVRIEDDILITKSDPRNLTEIVAK